MDSYLCPQPRQRYPLGEPHPALPVHHQCRCVLLPVTPLSDLVEEQRPMARSDFMKNAMDAYKKRFPNKDWNKLSESTKKKYYYEAMRLYEQRTGEPAYTQVSSGVSFRDYFEKHMSDDQRLKWLGPERFKIWKHGNLPLDKFIPPYPDKRLTVDALKALDLASFSNLLKRKVKKKSKNTQASSLTPKKTKEELHKEHLKHRQAQEKIAYENRLNKWKREIVKNGGSNKIADVLAQEYNIEVAKLHKPPPVKFVRQEEQTFCAYDGSYIQLHKDPSNWYGYPDTARHEFVHWKHYWAMKKGFITPQELIEAAKKDYNSFLDNCQKSGISLDVFKRSYVYNTVKKYYPDFKNDDESSASFKLTSVIDAI